MRYSPPLRSEEKVKGLIPQMPLITAELIPSSILHLPYFFFCPRLNSPDGSVIPFGQGVFV